MSPCLQALHNYGLIGSAGKENSRLQQLQTLKMIPPGMNASGKCQKHHTPVWQILVNFTASPCWLQIVATHQNSLTETAVARGEICRFPHSRDLNFDYEIVPDEADIVFHSKQ